jgi:protein-S-isoprenylcysteine O-methyltransferase Ste14
VLRFFHAGALAVHSPVLGVIGALICVSGIAVAVWARVDLGGNWGMPMTQKSEPELVTSGPTGWSATRSTRGCWSPWSGPRW